MAAKKRAPKAKKASSSKTMTKAQVLKTLAEKLDMSKKQATAFMDELACLAYTQTKKNGSFTLPGFGKLVLVNRKARMGRNPATGEAIKIKAKRVVKMRLAKACKEAIL
jgi:DNA-binding protein HU-beta